MPRVSVIIPTYNYGHFVTQTIDSVLQQTYRDFEIIVVDDGSTDDTAERLQSYIDRKQINYVYQKNLGLPGARNTGVRASQGSLIAFVDSDDLWAPKKLELQVPKFDQAPDVGVVFGNTRKFYDQMISRTTAFGDIPPARGRVLCELIQRTFVPMPTVVIRRECFETVGWFDEPLQSPGEDIDLWLRLSLKYSFDYVDDVVAFYRIHATSISANVVKIAERRLQVLTRFIDQHRSVVEQSCQVQIVEKVLVEAETDVGKYSAALGDPKKGRPYLRKAIAQRPEDSHLKLLFASSFVPGLLPALYRWKVGKIKSDSFTAAGPSELPSTPK